MQLNLVAVIKARVKKLLQKNEKLFISADNAVKFGYSNKGECKEITLKKESSLFTNRLNWLNCLCWSYTNLTIVQV